MHLKRFFYIISIFLLIIIFIYPYKILADEIDYSENEININNIIETSNNIDNLSSINSRSYVVLDRQSNTVMIGKNENQKRKMASTTKIMTALIVLENSKLDTLVEVSKKSAETGGSRLGLKAGDKITIHDLLYGLMLCSGNDAAVCLAESVSGNLENFSNLMNKKAKELNLANTNFVTPHGLDNDNHYTTAYELAILSNYALNNPTFLKIVNTKMATVYINGYPKTLSNTNELLGNLTGVYGIKTGFTNGANRCLVTACKRNNMDIICVVLGADTKNFRTQDSIKLIEYAFKNFEYFNLKNFVDTEFNKWKNLNSKKIYINKGISQNIDIRYWDLDREIIPLKKQDINQTKISISANLNLEAPISNGTIIGNLQVINNDKILYTTEIICTSDIKKKNIYNYIFDFFKNYSNILNYSIF